MPIGCGHRNTARRGPFGGRQKLGRRRARIGRCVRSHGHSPFRGFRSSMITFDQPTHAQTTRNRRQKSDSSVQRRWLEKSRVYISAGRKKRDFFTGNPLPTLKISGVILVTYWDSDASAAMPRQARSSTRWTHRGVAGVTKNVTRKRNAEIDVFPGQKGCVTRLRGLTPFQKVLSLDRQFGHVWSKVLTMSP